MKSHRTVLNERSARQSRTKLYLASLLLALSLAGASRAALPTPIVDLRFDEQSGLSAANAGSFGGQGEFAQANDFPVFSTNVPTGPMAPDNNTAAVDFGSIGDGQGGRAVDFTLGPDGTLGTFSAFTITGWVNARDLTEGWGGNRLVFGLAEPGGAGIDLVQLRNGALRIGINQWPDANPGGPSSSTGAITADANTGSANWVFFAVTYDSALESGNLQYFFGGPTRLAQLDSTHNYRGGNPDNGGLIEYSGPLTIGNFSPIASARNETGPGGGSRVFRGLIDEVKIYSQALTLADIQRAQLNGKEPAAPLTIVQQPVSQTAFAGQPVVLQVQVDGAAPISYQWQRNGSDIPNATQASYTIPAAVLSDSGAKFSVKITNAGGMAESEPATLTVMEESGHKVFLSFSEGALTTTNRGNLGGKGLLVQRDGYPLASDNAPAGSFAPADNLSSVNFGPILENQGGRAIDFTNAFGNTLGAMSGFTVSGWVNATDLRAGWGGNRIVFALAEPGGPGFDVVQLADGALQLGVNQWPDGTPAMSSPGMITESADANPGNWVFFALTYDGTSAFGNTTFYFGKPNQAAQVDVTVDYDRGPILRSGSLTIGNFSTIDGARDATGPAGGSRVFRGLIDEVNVFNRVLSLEEIQAVQKAPAYRPVEVQPIVITAQPENRTVFAGKSATLQVAFTGSAPFTIQWQRNGQDIPGANEMTYTVASAAVADNGARFTAKISNSAGTVTSEPGTLTIVSDTGNPVWLSFSEGNGTTTANSGDLAGSGSVDQSNGFPVFSTQVPSGAFAPANNTSSIDFGTIEDGQGGRAIDFSNSFDNTLGSMSAFTVTGWLNSRDLRAGWGGNRITFALASPDGPGFDLVQLDDGSLRLGVNQWPDGSGGGGPPSTPGMITEDSNTAAGNWVFFAVSYDSAAPFYHVNYYFGKPIQAAELSSSADYYDRGPVAQSGPLSIGNFGPVVGARDETGPTGGSRVFRGLIDEIKVFSKALTLEEIQAQQKAAAKAPTVVPRLAVTRNADSLTISWPTGGNVKLQSTDHLGSGAWADVTSAPVVNGNQATVTVTITGTSRFYRLLGL